MKICFLIVCLVYVVLGRQVTFLNSRNKPIWIGIQSLPGKKLIKRGGFKLKPSDSKTFNFPNDWAGRIWGRTGCNFKLGRPCDTGDCGKKLHCQGEGGIPPATAVEFIFNAFENQDMYGVSVVNGFNLNVVVHPTNPNRTKDYYRCNDAKCNSDLNASCPSKLRVKNRRGDTIACMTPCLKYHSDEYCCAGNYSTPETCKPDSTARYFKDLCWDSFNFAFADPTSLFTCSNSNYIVYFT